MMKPGEIEKKEIRKVQLFTKTIPSGVQVNNIILDNTEIRMNRLMVNSLSVRVLIVKFLFCR